MIANVTMKPTPVIPNHNLARAYVILQIPLALMKMSAILKGLILLWFCVLPMEGQQDLTKPSAIAPALKTIVVEVMERPLAGASEYQGSFHLTESLRSRYLRLVVDRSVCKGKPRVNDGEAAGEDITGLVRFDRANEISVGECLERTPSPVQVLALPKVHIGEVSVRREAGRWQMDVVVRNTLHNSASCTLKAGEHEEDFFLGPETSQTRSFPVRLDKGSILLELYKFEEAMEGAYQHLYPVEFPKRRADFGLLRRDTIGAK